MTIAIENPIAWIDALGGSSASFEISSHAAVGRGDRGHGRVWRPGRLVPARRGAAMSLGEEEAAKQLSALKAKKAGVGMTVVGLDPGTKSTGIAVIRDGTVITANVIRASGKDAKERLPEMCCRVQKALHAVYSHHPHIDRVAIEWQMIRPDDPRPNDILHMAIVLGAALAVPAPMFAKVLLPLPVQWKGSIDGDIFTKRVQALAHGQAAMDLMDTLGVPQSEQHNGLDAVALALWSINQRLPWAV